MSMGRVVGVALALSNAALVWIVVARDVAKMVSQSTFSIFEKEIK